jgi:Uma2 family endonuclease
MVASRFFDTITVEEYLEAEQYSEVRHEYLYGEVYTVPDSGVTHSLITGNILVELHQAANKPTYRVYQNAMLLRANSNIFYYPDIMVASGKIVHEHYEVNPCIIVETISKMTARQDIIEKRHVYLGLECLQLYLLVDSRKRWIKGYQRIKGKWEECMYEDGEDIPIPSVKTKLTWKNIYDKTNLA